MTTISRTKRTATRSPRSGSVSRGKGAKAKAPAKKVKAPSAFEIDMLVKTGKGGPTASIERVLPHAASKVGTKGVKKHPAPVVA